MGAPSHRVERAMTLMQPRCETGLFFIERSTSFDPRRC